MGFGSLTFQQELTDTAWSRRRSGLWIREARGISEETVGTHPDTGEVETKVVLDRRIGARPLMPPTLLFEDFLCVPRQIAALLNKLIDQTFEEL
jgi:hypothetical protein